MKGQLVRLASRGNEAGRYQLGTWTLVVWPSGMVEADRPASRGHSEQCWTITRSGQFGTLQAMKVGSGAQDDAVNALPSSVYRVIQRLIEEVETEAQDGYTKNP